MVPALVHRRPCHIDLSLFSITGVVRSRVFKPAVWTAGTAASLAGASYGHPEEGSASGVRQTTLSEDRHQTKYLAIGVSLTNDMTGPGST
jgi:hypothetical protein